MLSFLKKIFGATVPAEPTPVPYKVETPVADKPSQFPFPNVKPTKSEKKLAGKKPVAKTKPARKPKAPKA